MKNLVQKINLEAPGVKERMFTAILGGKIDGWEKCLNRDVKGNEDKDGR